ncbi:MAG: HEPN domain-containing protein [bacterium]
MNNKNGNHENKNQKELMIKYWWEKAQNSFDSAKREFKAGAYEFAINRLYYSAFYAVSALLMENDMSFKKHTGVRSFFHKEFIKKGLIEVKWGRFYDRLFEDRQEGDYTAFANFEEDYVKEQINSCEKFLKQIEIMMDTLD